MNYLKIRTPMKRKETMTSSKGHKAENLQKECLFLLYYHFPMEDSNELLEYKLE